MKEIEPFFSHPSEEDSKIKDFAKSIMENYAIKSGNEIFELVEIELYWSDWDKKDNDSKITYPRTAEAKQLFYHLSGIDICFKSDKNSYGGILIRAVRRHSNGKIIGGPYTAGLAILNAMTDAKPCLVEWSPKESIQLEDPTLRSGIHKDRSKRNLRFVIKGLDLIIKGHEKDGKLSFTYHDK